LNGVTEDSRSIYLDKVGATKLYALGLAEDRARNAEFGGTESEENREDIQGEGGTSCGDRQSRTPGGRG